MVNDQGSLRRRVESYGVINRITMRHSSSASIVDSDKSTVIIGDRDDDTQSSIGDDDITEVRNPPPMPMPEGRTFLQKAKFHTSLCLGTTAILAVFGFLFLIPFVVEPAISTILADFSPLAVACVVTEHIYAEGLKNCSWASCREGEKKKIKKFLRRSGHLF